MTISGAQSAHPVTFAREIAAILTKRGCNGTVCHGGVKGRGGFKLTDKGELALVAIQRLLHGIDDFAADMDPVWSPKGDKLVYESVRTGNWDLYQFDVINGVETQLTDSPANVLVAEVDGKIAVTVEEFFPVSSRDFR